MRNLLWVLLVFAVLLTGCNIAPVVYDEYNDGVRYKPESDWDYVQDLGPSDTPMESAGDN